MTVVLLHRSIAVTLEGKHKWTARPLFSLGVLSTTYLEKSSCVKLFKEHILHLFPKFEARLRPLEIRRKVWHQEAACAVL